MNKIITQYFLTNPGAQHKMSLEFGISRAAVNRWHKTGKVPANRCIAVEKYTGISRHELRPDVFGPEG